MTFSDIKDIFTGGKDGALIDSITMVFDSYEEFGLTVDEAIDRYVAIIKVLDR